MPRHPMPRSIGGSRRTALRRSRCTSNPAHTVPRGPARGLPALGRTSPPTTEAPADGRGFVVGDTGIEPVTSSVSGKRATAAPIAQSRDDYRSLEVDTGFEPVYTALQAAASPLGQSTVHGFTTRRTGMNSRSFPIRADDEIRTRDPHLGKVMRYHCATSALPAFLRAERL